MWFLERLNPGLPVYNEAEAVRLLGELNIDAMERALNVIVARHEVLRTTIQVMDSQPMAVVHENWPIHVKQIDLSALAPPERQAEVERLLIDEPRQIYHLETEPGIRVTLLRLGPREHVFILMMHHIICDWHSEGILWRELAALYRSFSRGEPACLAASGDSAQRLRGPADRTERRKPVLPKTSLSGRRISAARPNSWSCQRTAHARRSPRIVAHANASF